MRLALMFLMACGPKDGPSAHARQPSVEGTWTSSSCEARTYPRILRFGPSEVQLEDRISPCPEGVTCVWSGVVHRQGTWQADGTRIQLTWTGEADPRMAMPAPTEFVLQDDAHGRTEAGCAYRRHTDAPPVMKP